jgi:arylsulfatase
MFSIHPSWFRPLVVLLLLKAASTVRAAEFDHRPDIVLILADDLGFSDLGCYGGEINTPHLDRLAGRGIRFTQFYNAARCCPTRASLLTGLYPHQAGVGHMTYDAGAPGYRGDLSRNSVTIAEVVGSAGYQTMMAGKWHVSFNRGPDGDMSNWPLARGFDRFFGTLPGHGSFWDPAGLMEGNRRISADGDFYYTEAITASAVECIENAGKTGKPFFLYVAYTAPHYPLHARDEYIRKYDTVYDPGWDVLRRTRYRRLSKLGIIDARWEHPTRDEASIPWAAEPHKTWQAHRMQVYAAMVEQMDVGVGEIVSALEKAGRLENTLLIFLSDNGASCEGHRDNKIERTGAPWTSSLIPKRTRDGRPVVPGDHPDLRLGPAHTYGSYGLRWASVSNAPFRRHKSWVHEGGIATPFIVHWPGQIKNGGFLCRWPAHVIDLMPTFVEVSQATYPKVHGDSTILPMQGSSLVRAFQGGLVGHKFLCWEHEGNRAVRKGKWKLVSEFPGTWKTFYPYPKSGAWELYDMEEDRGELDDLAAERPEVVEELAAIYERWAEASMVVPWEELEGKQE